MKPGRNDPCPCGSGKKYKHCCQAKEADGAGQANAGQLMQAAAAHHHAGQLAYADDICRMVLQAEPNRPDALNLSGLIAYQTGQGERAVNLIGQAISANRRVPDYHNNLGNILIVLGRFAEAEALVKISDEAYRAWAEVLRAVPGSRLMLKTAELSDAAARERVAGRFTEAGVAAERIIMQGKTPWEEHVQAYNRVDIALDPFPHGGGVTTLEGLMMGAPTVTLRWPTTAGRLSASIMTTLGLTDWIAETREQYVALAVRKASDLPSLATLRRQLRGIFTSVIGDQEAYARTVEQEYRYLWRRWCAGGAGKE